jgi:hypothetical protein
VIDRTLKVFNYKKENGRKYITNKDFRELLSLNEDYIKQHICVYFFENIKDMKNTSKKVKKIKFEKYKEYKEEIRSIYGAVKEIFEMIDISMVYADSKNTTKDCNKILIKNKNDLVKYEIKKKIVNKSLVDINNKIKICLEKNSKNYKLNKKEKEIINNFSDYYENINDTLIKLKGTENKPRYYLFGKIEVYKVNEKINNYKFYKPQKNKELLKLEVRIHKMKKNRQNHIHKIFMNEEIEKINKEIKKKFEKY